MLGENARENVGLTWANNGKSGIFPVRMWDFWVFHTENHGKSQISWWCLSFFSFGLAWFNSRKTWDVYLENFGLFKRQINILCTVTYFKINAWIFTKTQEMNRFRMISRYEHWSLSPFELGETNEH